MKKIVLSLVAIATLGISASAETFVDFIVKQAHEKNFTKCDNGIREVFQAADGDKINVSVSKLNNNTVMITSVWGSIGDSAVESAIFTINKNKCDVAVDAVAVADMNCSFFAQDSGFEVVEEFLDYKRGVGEIGAMAYFKTVNGNGCLANFQNVYSFPIKGK